MISQIWKLFRPKTPPPAVVEPPLPRDAHVMVVTTPPKPKAKPFGAFTRRTGPVRKS